MSLRVLSLFLLLGLFSSGLHAQIEAKLALGLIDREGLGVEIPIGPALSIESRFFYHGQKRSNFFIDAELNTRNRFFSKLLMLKRYFKVENTRAGFYWGMYAYYNRESNIALATESWTPAQSQNAQDRDIDVSTVETRLGFGPFMGYKYQFENGINIESSLGIAASTRQWIKTRKITYSNQTIDTIYDPNMWLLGGLAYFWPSLQVTVGYRFQ
ncbi:MAG: hypothetical protein AAFN10_03375 [Bacteroidota bacterium]